MAHAELQLGDSRIMLADEAPAMHALSPKSVGGTSVSPMVYVKDVDKVFKHAITTGAKQLEPLENKFYGDRAGSVTDPFEHRWYLATHVEDLSLEEIQQRSMALH